MSTSSLTLDYSDPNVPNLLHETDALKVLELIRTNGRPTTVRDIMTATGFQADDIHRYVDMLLEHGILKAVRARKPRKSTGYRATCEQLVIAFDEHDEEVVRQLMASAETHRTEHERDVEQHRDPEFHSKAGFRFQQVSTHHFSQEDFAELRRRVLAVVSFLNMPRNPSRKSNSSDALSPEEVRYCNQAISIKLDPLTGDLLPLPTIITTPRSKLDQWDDSTAVEGGLNALSPREREIAMALAEGMTRTKIASQLDISTNTVSTLARRAYRKIGVSSQAELTARLNGHDRPTPGEA